MDAETVNSAQIRMLTEFSDHYRVYGLEYIRSIMCVVVALVEGAEQRVYFAGFSKSCIGLSTLNFEHTIYLLRHMLMPRLIDTLHTFFALKIPPVSCHPKQSRVVDLLKYCA